MLEGQGWNPRQRPRRPAVRLSLVATRRCDDPHLIDAANAKHATGQNVVPGVSTGAVSQILVPPADRAGRSHRWLTVA